MDLKKYYEFFGNTSFGSNSNILFMQDGGFVVYDKQAKKVACYTADCESFFTSNRLNDVVALCETSTVIVRDVKMGGFHVYKHGKNIAFILFEHVANCTMDTQNNSSIIVNTGDHKYSYIISTANKKGFGLNLVDYINPHFYREDGYGNVALNSYANHLSINVIDAEGEAHEVEGISKIVFLYGKRAIVTLSDGGTELVSYGSDDDNSFANLTCLLHSDKRNGIEPCGNHAAVFDNKLFALACDGSLLSEVETDYDEDTTIITPTGVKITPYVINDNGTKSFYPAASFCTFDVEDKNLFVFFYRNKFYPIFIDKGYDYAEIALLNNSVPVEYADMISQALLGRKL